MSDTKHTPTPYRIEPFFEGADDGGSVDEGFSLMADGMEEPIAIIERATYRHHVRYRADYSGERKDTSLEIDTANAEFLCRAANCHDELVTALHGTVRDWHDAACERNGELSFDDCDCFPEARAILAKAKDQ